MSSFRNHPSTAETDSTNRFFEVPNTFRRRLVNSGRCLWPRRYVIALMFFLLLLIQAWRNLNVIFTLAHVIVLGEAAKVKYPSIGHWTLKELDNYKTGSLVAEAFALMPGALLIFTFSSHKYLLASVTATSILHMLTPVALSHHSASLLLVLVSQSVTAAPMNVAVMAMWKDWAPPAEKTKLMIFSFCGIFVGAAATTFYPFLFHYVTSDSSYYLSGVAGIIWVLFWYNMISDTPQNDPLISEEELLYLENNIPSDNQQEIKIKDVPWISIITSKHVLLLCLVFFKMALSVEIITIGGTLFTFHLGLTYNPLHFFIPFLSSIVIIIPCSAILADYLIKKFSGRTLLIRQIFMCGGFFLQCLFMLGTLANSVFTKTIFYMVSYSIFAISLPGFITIALDLSPRYIAIIAGILFTFFTLGFICITYFIEATISLLHLSSISWLFLFDGAFSLFTAILFVLCGDVAEQLWSLTFPSSPRTQDYRSYPQPDDEDDLNLVTKNV